MLKAILWDVDGTLAETERDGHLVAFNRAFEALAIPWRWNESRYGELLAVAGGRERLLYDLERQPQAPPNEVQRAALVERIHRLKNEYYAAIVAGGALPLRAGVAPLFADCAAAGVAMGIATTTSAANVAALLSAHLGCGWRSHFAAVVCAEQAPLKKPDPQVYLHALQSLGLAADEVLAIEDSPAGIAATRAAGIAVVVARSFNFADIDLGAALSAGPSLGSARDWRPLPGAASDDRITLSDLVRWHRARPAKP
jgi:HAD superfamily hydrolase (TIGR01509 family)